MKKKISVKKLIYDFLILVFVGIFIFALYHIIIWYKDNKYTENKINEIKENANVTFVEDKEQSYIDANFEELLKANEETVGWINVPGTWIDYSIVRHSDNDYYLTHSFDNTWNGAGWIFADFRTDLDNLSQNNVVYGHSMINRSMFGTLRNVFKDDYLNERNEYYIYISTSKYNYVFQIFSAYHIEPTDDYLTTAFNQGEFETWLDMVSKRSMIDYKASATTEDKILTLSTCYSDSERMAVHAKLIKQNIRH